MNVDEHDGRFGGIGTPELHHDEELAWRRQDSLGIQQDIAV